MSTSIIHTPTRPFRAAVNRASDAIRTMSMEDLWEVCNLRRLPEAVSLVRSIDGEDGYWICVDPEHETLLERADDDPCLAWHYHLVIELRVESTERAIRELARVALSERLLVALVERFGAENGIRYFRRAEGWRLAEDVIRSFSCPIQRAERRAEFVADSRMSGTPIDWDEYSNI